ncbi:MAG: segregation/condensation protein A [Clostridia bacterium]|nr:segregation/condensation protein A [Clostridia bacterium]
MANFYEQGHPANNIILNIQDFSGPIELLYELIVRDGRYDIKTFPLALITDTYVRHMEQVDKLDMEEASEYIVIAATLLEIKSRACLPVVDDFDDYEDLDDGIDPEAELRRKILMFEMFKTQSIKLKEKETLNKFYRRPKFTNADALIVVNDFSFDKLIEAYGKLLLKMTEKEQRQATKKIQKDRFTVADKIVYISKVVIEKKSVVFNKLFEEDITKSEVITTFQALLELMKKQIVTVMQKSFADDILIMLNDNIDQENLDLQQLKKTEEAY